MGLQEISEMVASNALSRGVFVVAAKRTPFGTFGGSLKSHSPTDLSVIASNAAIKESGLSPEHINSVCIGNVLSASAPDAPYLARHVALKCGLPVPTPALIVNRLCGSGFQSIVNGVQEILAGDAKVVPTGGTDNMSACPYAVRDIRFGTKLGSDPNLEDMMWTSLTDRLSGTPMGVTAENLAAKFDVTREDCDAFALRSQQTWGAAAEAGVFADEITPITLKIKKKEVEMKLDEHPKPKTTLEQLAKLPPVFKKGGVVTAGGASGICDGAAAVMVASEEAVKEHNLTPLARIVGYGVADASRLSWALDRFHPSRPCWRRLVLAWERLTRSKSTKPLLHKHSPAKRLWTSPWRSSTHVEVLLHWATPSPPLVPGSQPTSSTS